MINSLVFCNLGFLAFDLIELFCVIFACSVMFDRLAKDGREYEEKTLEDVHEYADAGLRTLILAYRELDEEKYQEFDTEFSQAKISLSADRETLIDEITDMIESDLILLGATAVEDKLQNGVSWERNDLLVGTELEMIPLNCFARFLIALTNLHKLELRYGF